MARAHAPPTDLHVRKLIQEMYFKDTITSECSHKAGGSYNLSEPLAERDRCLS